MRIDFKFRNTDHSDELMDYVSERVTRLEKFERKPVRIEITFSKQKQTCRVDISIHGKGMDLHSHHESSSFFDSAEDAIDKISRQMERKKHSRTHQRRPKPYPTERKVS